MPMYVLSQPTSHTYSHLCSLSSTRLERFVMISSHCQPSLLNHSTVDGCNHLSCRCNWYDLPPFEPLPLTELCCSLQCLLLRLWSRYLAFHQRTRGTSSEECSL